MSGTHPNNITCLSVYTCHIYAAAENIVYAWRKGKKLKHLQKHKHSIHIILLFRSHFLSVDINNDFKDV